MADEEDPGREAWTLLFQLFRSQRREFAALQSELGINMAQAGLLKHLDGPRGAAMSELAEHLCCDASYITGLVDKLETRGLVERLPDPEDRRVKRIALTEAGASLRKDLVDRFSRPPAFIQALPVEDRLALRDIFLKASRNTPAEGS